MSRWGAPPLLSHRQGPTAVRLGERSAPEAVGYLALRLLNLRGRHGHPVLQLRQRLVRGPGGLHGALRARGALFPSVCLACRRAHLGQERLQASPTRTSSYHSHFSSLLELGGQTASQGLGTLRPLSGPLTDLQGSAVCPGLGCWVGYRLLTPGPGPTSAHVLWRSPGAALPLGSSGGGPPRKCSCPAPPLCPCPPPRMRPPGR